MSHRVIAFLTILLQVVITAYEEFLNLMNTNLVLLSDESKVVKIIVAARDDFVIEFKSICSVWMKNSYLRMMIM